MYYISCKNYTANEISNVRKTKQTRFLWKEKVEFH